MNRLSRYSEGDFATVAGLGVGTGYGALLGQVVPEPLLVLAGFVVAFTAMLSYSIVYRLERDASP